MPQDRPHKFEPGPDWTKITWRVRRVQVHQRTQPGTTPADSLDKELGKDKVNDVLGDYLQETETETESAVKNLLRAHLELAGNEALEAMDVDEQPPQEPVAETQECGRSTNGDRTDRSFTGILPTGVGNARLQSVPGRKY